MSVNTNEPPSPPRQDTFAIDLGLKKIRWHDSPAIIREFYPQALFLTSMQGRNPQTGNIFNLGRNLLLNNFISLPGLILHAVVGLEADEAVSLDLFTRDVYQQMARQKPLQRALQLLFHDLGCELKEIPLGEHRWGETGKGVLTLFRTKADFLISLYAPATEHLERQNPIHRAYRLLQAQQATG